jgi:hypothetical protein
MPSEAEERQALQADNELMDFVKTFVKKYPLVFKSKVHRITIFPSLQHPFFPFKVVLEVTKKEEEL